MLGWIICKLKDGGGEIRKTDSIFGHVKDLAYGTLSDGDWPPNDSWVFLAKGLFLGRLAHFFYVTHIFGFARLLSYAYQRRH
jgi:hypothetical protein